jgi:hypothetical protein
VIYSSNYTERELKKEQKRWILMAFPIAFLVFGIVANLFSARSLGDGLSAILTSPTTLLTDFIQVGGVGASFINAAVIGFFNIYLLKRYEMRVNGLLIAAVLTVLGFSFIGKNIINILPIYFGGYLYSRYQKIPTKNVILVIMFSTALAPIVSEITFGGIFQEGFNYLMGIVSGTLIGFIIVPLASHMLRFHDGYNLYNIGFTAGIVGMVFTSFLRNFKINIMPVNIIYTQQNYAIIILLYLLFVFLCIVGIKINHDAPKLYKNIFHYKGRTVTDFTSLIGYGLTFLNMGIMGILSLSFALLLGGIINGPVIAGILTIVGFGAFGKHPANCAPIVIGVMLGGLFFRADFSSTGFIISALFGTTIAPIAGAFGPIIGVIAGILHLTLVTNTGIIHGGINLYNNGFAGGLVAGFLVPIIDAFRKGDQ